MNASKLSLGEVIDFVTANRNKRLVTVIERRAFRIRLSEVGGVRFDRRTLRTYDTVKRRDIDEAVSTFSRLPSDDRFTPSRYRGSHRAASYICALLKAVVENRDGAEMESSDELDGTTGGQGFGLTPQEREAVEDLGMERAIEHFEEENWTVVPQGKPYDLLCTKPGQPPLYVEVKATTGNASPIRITAGEARFSLSHRVALYVLYGVKVQNGCASGGKEHIIESWRFEKRRAEVVQYRYHILP